MYPQLRHCLQTLLGSLLILSCSSPVSAPTSNKASSTPSSQATSKPLSKTPRVLAKLELGDTAETLDRLYDKLPAMVSSQQLTYGLQRELKEAANEIDLSQGSEAALGYAEDLLGFVVFSFALKKEHHLPEKLKSTPGLDAKGHQFVVRPLPGSLLSPFNRPLYLDVVGERLFVSDQAEGLERVPLKEGLTTPTLHASIDFASLWYVFGVPYQEVYISEKDNRQFQSTQNEPAKPRQGDIFWESLFLLADSIAKLEVQAEVEGGVLVSVEVTTKVKLPANLDSLSGDPYQVIPSSQFGLRAVLPKSVIRVIAAARRRLAPPAFDSLAMYYPISENLRGALLFGGGIDEKEGFWSVGQYPIDDIAVARLSVQRHFSETPKPDAMFLEPGRTFEFKTLADKDKSGGSVDVVSSTLKAPTPLEKALQIDAIETRYQLFENKATTLTGKSPSKHEGLLAQEGTIPEALAALLGRQSSSASQPTSQASAPAPMVFLWLSRVGVVSDPKAPIDTAVTLSQLGDKLLLKVALLP